MARYDQQHTAEVTACPLLRPGSALPHTLGIAKVGVPRVAQARLLMARLLSRSDKVDEAIEELDGFYNSNPSNIGATVSLARLEEQRGNSERAVEALLDELERSLGPAPDQQAAVSYYRAACAPQQEQIRNRLKEQGGQGEAFARFARPRAGDSSRGGPLTPVRWRRELSDERRRGLGNRRVSRSFDRYDIAREGYRNSEPNGQGARILPDKRGRD